jgi:antitoxin YefM
MTPARNPQAKQGRQHHDRTRIRTMTKTMTVTDAKARLSELVAAVASTHDHIEITRNGEPAAVLISAEELAALRETIAILSDPGAVAQIKESEQDIAAGRVMDAEDLREALEARRGKQA